MTATAVAIELQAIAASYRVDTLSMLLRLSGHRFALVDDADYDWLAGRLWQYGSGAARNYAGTMHAAIGEHHGIGKVLYHRNGWRLDNRRDNLMSVTPSELQHYRRRSGPIQRGEYWEARIEGRLIGTFVMREWAQEKIEQAELDCGFLTVAEQRELRVALEDELERLADAGEILATGTGSKLEDMYLLPSAQPLLKSA